MCVFGYIEGQALGCYHKLPEDEGWRGDMEVEWR